MKMFLDKSRLNRNPIKQFAAWFNEAKRRRGLLLPEAMCLSTVASTGGPEGRMVLLKQVDARGFVFFTDTRSPKGRALRRSRRVALTFYWYPLGRQVRIVGRAALVAPREADAYFRTRPRGSQMAAWASRQSEELTSRAVLDRRVAACEKRFEGQRIPRPPYWSGFRVAPSAIEFWQERSNRLHDRLVYVKRKGQTWHMKGLYP